MLIQIVSCIRGAFRVSCGPWFDCVSLFILDRWIHRAVMFDFILCPGDRWSVGGKGPSDSFTISTRVHTFVSLKPVH